jgi:hypothetical protein
MATLMTRMAGALRDCSDELEQVVEAHYERTKHYPSEMRRYQRDIEPVIRARELLAEFAEAAD